MLEEVGSPHTALTQSEPVMYKWHVSYGGGINKLLSDWVRTDTSRGNKHLGNDRPYSFFSHQHTRPSVESFYTLESYYLMAGPQVRGYLRIQASIKVAATSFHEAVPIGRKLAAKVLIHPGPSAPVNAGETKGACVYGIGNWKKTLRNAYHSFSVKHQATVCLCVGGQEASCCRGIWGQLCVFNPALVLHCVCASTGLDGRFLILNKPPPATTTTNFSSSSSSL